MQKHGPNPGSHNSETLGMSFQQSVLIRPAGDCGACSSPRPADTDVTHPDSDAPHACAGHLPVPLLIQVTHAFHKILHTKAFKQNMVI